MTKNNKNKKNKNTSDKDRKSLNRIKQGFPSED